MKTVLQMQNEVLRQYKAIKPPVDLLNEWADFLKDLLKESK